MHIPLFIGNVWIFLQECFLLSNFFFYNVYYSFNSFDTKACYYFEPNISLVLLIKVFLTKKMECNYILKSFKHEEITSSFESFFFFLFSPNTLKRYRQKHVKSEDFGKNVKRGLDL